MIPGIAMSGSLLPGVDASESGGARHAALLLHAMAQADREWVLDALPPAQRQPLTALLAELEALGIERDPGLVAEATAHAASAATAAAQRIDDAWLETPMSDEAMLQQLSAARVEILAKQLQSEPAGLVAALLRAATWSWHGTLLQALEPVQRRRVEAALAERAAHVTTPPALRAALIASTASRLREQTLESPHPRDIARRPSLGQSLRQWLDARRRLGGARR